MSDDDGHRDEWCPATGLVVIGWLGAAAAAAWAVLLARSGADPAGQLLAAVTAVALALAAVYGTRARPRLRVDDSGITVTGLVRRRHLPWHVVQEVRVHQVRRWGRKSPFLEIDTVAPDGTEQLFLFGRLDLNADPIDVAEVLNARRP